MGEATIPPIRVFHKLLGVDEQEFMRATLATFKVGISFENWGQQGDSYIHSFGKTGKETWLGDFHHFWLRSRELGMDFEFGDFCLEVQASLTKKFYTGPNAILITPTVSMPLATLNFCAISTKKMVVSA